MRVVRYNDRAGWLAARRRGIGGSDVASVLGLSPWRSPFAVWSEKVGLESERPETEAIRWGSLLEPLVVADAERQTGVRIERTPLSIAYSDEDDGLFHSPDGFVTDERGERIGLVEVKTATPWKRADWRDGVPPYYMPQVQSGLHVTGFARCLVAVFLGTVDGVLWCWVDRDPAWWPTHEATLREFLRRIREEDAPAAGAGDAGVLANIYSDIAGDAIPLVGDMLDVTDEIDRIAEEQAERATRDDALRNRVRQTLGQAGATRGVLPDGSGWTWKADRRGTRVLRRFEKKESA